jgi:hypothetical protein
LLGEAFYGAGSNLGVTSVGEDDLGTVDETHPDDDPEPTGVPLPPPCLVPGDCLDDDDRPEEGQLIYRVYGGDSPIWGQSWTPIDPRVVQHSPHLVQQWGKYAFRAVAGLPDWNSGAYLVIARLRSTEGVEARPAEPMRTTLHPGKRWPGELPEYFFDSPPVPGRDIDFISDEPLVPRY